jgi:hypothetical protein
MHFLIRAAMPNICSKTAPNKTEMVFQGTWPLARSIFTATTLVKRLVSGAMARRHIQVAAWPGALDTRLAEAVWPARRGVA